MPGRMYTLPLFLLALLLFSPRAWADQAMEQAAIRQAENRLSAVDSGQYGASWDAAAVLFKNAVPKEQWIRSMNAHRKPLGTAVRRELKDKQYVTSLPGAPDGQYVVIRYAAAFANKQEAVGAITPMLDSDGVWRVSGYFIQ